jgi:alanine racemase
MCVVKADAYGHNAESCVRALCNVGARDFAVSSPAEAVQVREAAGQFAENLLILGYSPEGSVCDIINEDIIQTIYSYDYALAMSEAALVKCPGRKLRVHIKIDTGMNRLGFRPDSDSEIVKVLRLPNFKVEGIFTHFACADEESDMTRRQYDEYSALVERLEEQGFSFKYKHVCNSAAAAKYPEYHHDFVRIGIALYGLSPFSEPYPAKITAVMRLMTKVANVHTVEKGDSISYGATFTAEHNIRTATLCIGYADGFMRGFSPGGSVIINGSECPILGRVTMDQCIVDIGDAEVSEGDNAIVFDDKGENIEKLAKVAGTINYELVCLVGKRVPRIIKNT